MTTFSDPVVFAHPDGRTYVACDDDGEWHRWGSHESRAPTAWAAFMGTRWPAERNDWQLRQSCSATLADDCSELEPPLAALALALSGVAP